MNGPIWGWSLAATRDAIARREISPVEAVEAVLGRIESRARINAYITVLGELALAEARQREQAVMRGEPLGPLHGVPIALKDNIATAGVVTTAGSPVRERWIPHEDADVVRALRAAGAVIIGKNNLFEVAFGAAHPRFGETLNPWDRTLSCGGSSSGSAAAVADGQAFGAVGTDTGGSIRIPAALCGIVGLKPTNGLLPNRGVIPVSPDLDAVGPMTRSVGDAEILLRGMGARFDARDGAARPFKVGIPRDLPGAPVAPRIADALRLARERLDAEGVEIREVALPDLSLALDVMWTIASADVAEYHRSDLQERAGDFHPTVRSNLLGGAMIPAVDYIRARRFQRRLRRDTEAAFGGVDAVLVPGLAIDAYRSGAQRITLGGRDEKILPVVMRFTPLANVTGQPAVIVPVDSAPDGPPLTVQLYGRHGRDQALLKVAAIVERRGVAAFPE